MASSPLKVVGSDLMFGSYKLWHTGNLSAPKLFVNYSVSFKISSTSGTQLITTKQFIDWLKSKNYIGVDKHYSLMGTWSYAGNDTISDGPNGQKIHLAGAVVEIYSGTTEQFRIKISTPSTSVSGGAIKRVFYYIYNGPDYSPGWVMRANYDDLKWNNISGKPSSFTPASHTHNFIASRGKVTPESGSTEPAVSGMSMSEAYSNGYPTTYGNIITLNGTGQGQLLIGWSSSSTTTSGAHAPVYVRSKRDVSTTLWSGWAQIYTTAHKPTAADIGAASSSHTHNYAGSSSAGGAANSANQLNLKSPTGDIHTWLTKGSSGLWYMNAANQTNAPQSSQDWHYYIGMSHANSHGYFNLLAFSLNSLNVFTETCIAGNWQGWRRFVFDDQCVLKSGGSGNAMTGDLYMGNHYVRDVTDVYFYSDIRLKKNVKNINFDKKESEKILSLKPKTYIKSGKPEIGYIAQDVQISKSRLLKRSIVENSDGFLSLSYREISILKTEALIQKVSYLENKIESLTKKLEKLLNEN